MPISISCPSCRASGQVPDEALGNQVTCPVCGTAFLLTKPQAPVEMPDGLGVWVDSSAAGSGMMPMPPEEVVEEFAEEVPAVAALVPSAAAEPAAPSGAVPDEWFRQEKERFDAYLAGGLARLDQARRENAEAESRHEAACVARSVELSRQVAMLDGLRQTLDRRDGELRRMADAVAAREGAAARLEADLSERELAVASREDHRAALESEAAELARLMAGLRPAVERLELRKTEAEAIRAKHTAKQNTLDRRLIEVGRIELALQKRMAEFDEMEVTLRQELEEREADLERQRTTLLEEVRTLRERTSVNHPTPMPRPSVLPLHHG